MAASRTCTTVLLTLKDLMGDSRTHMKHNYMECNYTEGNDEVCAI